MNDDLKSPYYGNDETRYQPYQGRYLVFGNTTYYPSSGQEGIIGCVNTLEEVSDLFWDNRKAGCDLYNIVMRSGCWEGIYSGIDVFDMTERRFVDINEIQFIAEPKLSEAI